MGFQYGLIVVAPPFFRNNEMAFFDQVVNDPLDSPFSDFNLVGNVSHAQIRMLAEQEEHMAVIGEKGPLRQRKPL